MDKPNQTVEAESAKKRSRDGDDDDADLDDVAPSELAKMSRSERKRHREKKRRSDVNKGFDDLMALLLEIDPTVRAEAEERTRRGHWKGTVGAQADDNILSRVDLISKAVDVLRRVHRENEERKQIIANLTRSASDGNQDHGLALPRTRGMDAPLTQNAAHSPNGDNREASLFGATDAYALRAAIESSQYYSQPLLTRLANDNAAASLPSRQSHDLLGLNSSMNLNLHSDLLAYANGSRLGASFATNEANHNGGTLLSGSTNLSSSVNQGIMNADAGSLALTRHYLQLLQTQQDAATLAQLAGAGSHVETATAASHLANERRDEYRE